ncbi:MAG: NAD(P)/FAD-dependent oxidoreductase [Candidatus Methanoperedens sp.]|nr:NAD(P)/FAD-dependent oxidoreductase [Candidatus Methanoperedens sp.]MCZ7371021.1 NAD(P)/FAD-dependent oxidoreductase [Candidatus Methanoperedens sp.]
MRYDVVVIGAGPAGSIAAMHLSSLGHRTLLIDPLETKKVCAGILTSQYARRYGIEDVLVEKELRGVRISVHDIRAEITYRKAVDYSINRALYDSFNLDLALAAGCELRKERVLSLDEKESAVVVRTRKERIIADYAIVAAGASELSALHGGTRRYAFCVQQKKDQKPGDYFEMELHNEGYSWIAPKKEHVLTGTSSLRDYPDIPGEKALIPLEPMKNSFSGRCLLAGDSAGFVSPFEGEGIYYARRSGEIAAETVSCAISGKNGLEEYERCWKREFDFSTLKILSRLLSGDNAREAFVRAIRDDDRFNKLVEDILTKNKRNGLKIAPFLIKTLARI